MPKVLVADDNTNIQKMVALALEERGINVVSVGNGEAAVRRISDVNPDLLLADIFMPVRNGYEVCEFVKKDQRFAHIPVILLVGAFDPLDEKEARRVGADGVLKKPFVPPDPLIAMVTSALERNPKLAAELASAKASKEVAQSQPPPELEIPARTEPKPLPDFPEPSQEEAAIVYGYGSGKRGSQSDGPASVPANPTELLAEPENESQEEFDSSVTSHDWRRSAMDFDVPEDLANKAAFPSTENLDAVNFPSEGEYPPRRVRLSEPVESAMAEDDPMDAQIESSAAPAQPQAADFFAPAESSAPEPTPALPETSPERAEIQPETHFAAETTHWMDAVAPPSSLPSSGWMDTLTQLQQEPGTMEESAAGPIPAEAPPAPPPAEESFFADDSAPGTSSASVAEVSEPGQEAKTFSPLAAARLEPELEPDAANEAPHLAFKDPALVEPPAVHVTPEPLLQDEEPVGASEYGAQTQTVEPAYEFFAQETKDDSVQESTGQHSSASVEGVPPMPPSFAEQADERVPTKPPASREALADIPFLTPSHAGESGPNGSSEHAPDSATVDAVVQKVLEKLGPQIHDLFSEAVLKPLVENLLHDETGKRAR